MSNLNNQHVEPELSVGEIIRLYLSHWRMFLAFTVVLFAIGVGVYLTKIPFVASSTILINDSQNSALQAFSTQYFGMSKTVQESKKGSSLLSKHIEYLKTREFYEALLQKVQERGQGGNITLEEQKGYEMLKENYLSAIGQNVAKKVQLLQTLNGWTKVSLDSDFEIRVSVATPSRPMSLFLSNSASELAAETLKKRELSEINRVEKFMMEQKRDSDKKMDAFGKQLAQLQGTDNNLLPLNSQGKMSDYVSDLIVRANEIKLRIAENIKMIDYLNASRSGQRESGLYGVGGRVEKLRIENSMLRSKLIEIQASIDRLKKDARQLPFAAQEVEDLKKKSELEFARFKELSTALAKLEAQKLSIDTRFEVLEVARWENTLPQIGLLTLGLIAVILSQLFGSVIIYFRYLWNPHVVTAQASRNLVIFDNHSVDPRVIIENSKIKFSLKNPEQQKAESVELDENGQPKKIAWNMFNWGRSSDISQ